VLWIHTLVVPHFRFSLMVIPDAFTFGGKFCGGVWENSGTGYYNNRVVFAMGFMELIRLDAGRCS